VKTDVANKVERFFGQYKLRTYPRGQVLILNGDNTNFIFHLVEGKVKMYDITYKGDQIVLHVYKPPAFFPMTMAINKSPNPFMYEAETAIQVHRAPAGEVIEFLHDNPDVMYELLARVYRRVEGLTGRIVQLMSGTAQSRLLFELLLDARRFGVNDTDGPGCSLSITERELGARAGLSRETVSREITKLKQNNLITLGRKGIHISDLQKMEQKLGIAY
jgi:CRP-like cAMP-binding protein